MYDSGCTFWDTADVYLDSEDIIGRWYVLLLIPRNLCIYIHGVARFKRTGKRNEIFLATKFGFALDGRRAINGAPEYVAEAAEKSMSRLGIDYIDLYYMHRYVFRPL